MRLRVSFIKQAAVTFIASVVLLSLSAVAQETRQEVSVQGTGFFTANNSGNGIQNQATETGGFLLGYRYNINRWLAGEADYGYDRNTQIYSGPVFGRVQTNIHQLTGSAVMKVPAFGRIQPYVLGGGGALIFDPTNNFGGIVTGASLQAKGAFVYGGGLDYPFMRHVALRVEYRGYVYQAPDFNLARLHANSWTNIAQPSAGFVFRF